MIPIDFQGKQPIVRNTAFIYDESYFWHDAGASVLALPPNPSKYLQPDGSAESPESKRRFKNLLEASGLYADLTIIKPEPVTEEVLQYFHTKRHIDNVKELSASGGGDCGALAIVGNGSYEIANLAVGGAVDAVRAVLDEKVDNAYALTRPPGHHAEKDRGMGFCIFNNVAIAAHYARKEYGLQRVAIIDWDVHHGNGTEDAFYDDPNVLFASLHQEGFFPANRGKINDIGIGKGVGATVNIPLHAGTGNAGYIYALEHIVVPVIDNFKPELIIISAGQDANIFDPLSRTMVTVEGYTMMTKIMMELADKHCKGRLVAVHEGGYSTAYVPFCSHAIIEELKGLKTSVGDPFAGLFEGTSYNTLASWQKERIEEIRKVHIK